ncbi:MAG: hypothetical protein HKP30_15625, partial [Myxococcales bacterium]|nr:hypothetical protein [Myxococcales bacterium]
MSKYAKIEFERRFLLAEIPAGLDAAAGFRRIDDRYLRGTSLRLRRVSDSRGSVIERKLNQKLPHDPPRSGLRIVTSVYLDAIDFELLAQLPADTLR